MKEFSEFEELSLVAKKDLPTKEILMMLPRTRKSDKFM